MVSKDSSTTCDRPFRDGIGCASGISSQLTQPANVQHIVQLRVAGPDDHDTLTTRNNIVGYTAVVRWLAALTVIEEGDGEDLRLILLLNRSNAQKHGAALTLLAGDREAAESPDDDERTCIIASLDYIAEWVVPGTSIAERAKDLCSRLKGQGEASA